MNKEVTVCLVEDISALMFIIQHADKQSILKIKILQFASRHNTISNEIVLLLSSVFLKRHKSHNLYRKIFLVLDLC